MSQKDTIDRVYSNAPRDIPNAFSFVDFVPDGRTIRYVWIRWIVRKFFR